MPKRSSESDGGPAFPAIIPVEHSDEQGKDYANFDVSGMTLRDYYAGQVLANATLMNLETWGVGNENLAARVAYIIADAMLKERAK